MKRLCILLLILALTGQAAVHWYHQATMWRDAAHQSYHRLVTLRQRQQQLARIDHARTEELSHALQKIDALQHRVDADRQRLQLHAVCPDLPARRHATTARLDDAPRARLTDAAQRDYFTLRRRIVLTQQQISGLQAYIRLNCQP
ncbi:lysis protein [Escherichia coli]|uniref:lysis protein n=1 Tax=Escherichia coli TaxID=562 RepID=UPI003F53D47C